MRVDDDGRQVMSEGPASNELSRLPLSKEDQFSNLSHPNEGTQTSHANTEEAVERYQALVGSIEEE